ncbi:maleylpyruvate isomerase family mycothiol-dependent enzyme [uncultured Streptomyces sp.]|uniref:maleylpyruvate isomerase family mycothiol-dependent enzyme n=1 Tax=uncultured Streptomyces sp. TaxID=174707 RepID=UPI00260D81BD|nr:maleylpyruvate isomerase family mycothiol-dependent enzyme [uncultured Streptomyces sp.]
MGDHPSDIESVDRATDRLLHEVAGWDPSAVAVPSLLPGWSRGHVLAHLSRNADALENVLRGGPMYASSETRDRDIARDAVRPQQVQLADLRASHLRFLAAARAPGDLSRTVELRNGVTDRASRLPFRRWVEVELHHVDLGAGYTLEDMPAEFTGRLVGHLAARYDRHPALVPVRLAADDGGTWTTGGGAEGPVTLVRGPAAVLAGWLSGRRAASAPAVEGGPLPPVPPL